MKSIAVHFVAAAIPLAMTWIVVRVVVRRTLRFIDQLLYETHPGDPWESDESFDQDGET